MNKYKYYPEIRDEIFSDSLDVRWFWGVSMPRSKVFFMWQYRSICDTFRKATDKKHTILPWVEDLVLKKKDIVEKIIKWKIEYSYEKWDFTIEKITRERMKALFKKTELENLTRARFQYNQVSIKRKNYRKYFKKIYSWMLRNRDLKKMISLFWVDEYAKMVVFYNNLMIKKKKPQFMVKEDESVIYMRNRIEKFLIERKNRKKYLDLFKKAQTVKFNTVEDLFKALSDISSVELFNGVQWRLKLHLIKYFVWENVQINNPWYEKWTVIKEFIDSSSARFLTESYIEQLLRSPMSLSDIKYFMVRK